MTNLKTKCGLIIIVGLCIASLFGAITLIPNTKVNRFYYNREISEIPNDFTLVNKSLKNSGAVPANFEWYRTCGQQWDDIGYGVALDSFGNVYFGGYTGWGWEGSNDMRLLKFNSTGHTLLNITWTYDYYGYRDDFCKDIAVDSLDNVILTGATFSKGAGLADLCVVKYNSQGLELWNKQWGTAKSEWGRSVAVDSSGNIYITGIEYDGYIETMNITVVKFNSTGSLKWSNKWKGPDDDEAFAIGLDSEENVIVGGYTQSFGAQERNTILLKFNKTNGNKLWNKTWGSSGEEEIHDLILDSEDNIFVVGCIASSGSDDWDILLAKFNKTGDYKWHYLWGKDADEIGYAIAMDSLNNIYLGGGDLLGNLKLVKCDYFGNQLWNESWGTYERCHSLVVDSQKNIYCGGYTWTQGAGEKDMVLVKYNHSRPELIINAPALNQVAGKKAPNFEVDVVDPYLNTSWYTINGSSLLHGFEGDTGTIDQNEWNLLDNGTLTLKFYANNSAGVENYKAVIIKRDVINPIIIVNSPTNGTGCFDPPSFNITVLEPNLKSIEYTIDNGASNWSCTLLGVILPSLWEAAKYGNVTIRFYAKDKGNNIEFAEVNVTKLLEQIAALLSGDDDDGGGSNGTKDAISGFHVILVIVILVSISILLIEKRIKPKLK